MLKSILPVPKSLSKPRVLLLCGGKSGEHEVSLSSARSVLAVTSNNFEITPLVITASGKLLSLEESQKILTNPASSSTTTVSDLSQLPTKSFDVVFPLLHGPYGEDGTIQGLLKLLGTPFVGSDVLGSAVGMDKLIMKSVFEAHNLPQVAYRGVKRAFWQSQPSQVLNNLVSLGFPLFVKPANLGSSVGINKANNEEELNLALSEAAKYDRRIIVEKGLAARELEVAILGNASPKASVVGEISFEADFYDYSTKYSAGKAKLTIPANIPKEVAQECRSMAITAFEAIDGAGLARVDFFYAENKLYINEINTMPGFTTTSMYPKLWEASGLSYGVLVEQLIELALEQQNSSNN